jgi:hypothetical protein
MIAKTLYLISQLKIFVIMFEGRADGAGVPARGAPVQGGAAGD